jgi:hypothetical protein
MSKPMPDAALPVAWLKAARWSLASAGGLVVAGTLARVMALDRAAGFGPAQLQAALVGGVLFVGSLVETPGRALAGALWRARRMRSLPPAIAAPAIRRSIRWRLAGIVMVALVFRVWMVGAYWPSNQITMGMALWDAEMARNLLHGDGWQLNWEFVKKVDAAVVARRAMVDPQDLQPPDQARGAALAPLPFYAHTPGYSVWLAISFALGGANRFVYSQWMQCALDSLACLLVFGIGRRLWSDRAGTIGALLYALSPAHVYLAIQTVSAATDSFWLLLIAYGVVRGWNELEAGAIPWRGGGAITVGAFAGTAMNSIAFLQPAIVAGWALLAILLRRTTWRMAVTGLVSQLVVVALLVPWGLRNRSVYGHFTFLRETTWQLVWEAWGQIPNPWGLAIGNNDAAYWAWVEGRCPAPCAPSAREAVTRNYVLSAVIPSRAFPAHLIRLARLRLPGLVYVSRLPADMPFPGDGFAASVARGGLALLNVGALLLFPLAAFGMVMIALRGTTFPAAWLALAPTVFGLAFSLFIFMEHRMTTPSLGYLVALSGIAVAGGLESHAENY